MKNIVVALLLIILAASFGAANPRAGADISGTWNFSVDLDGGGHGDPTFVFKQEGEKLTGTYKGQLGEYNVTGSVTGDKAVFAFDFKNDDLTDKSTYTATIERPTK